MINWVREMKKRLQKIKKRLGKIYEQFWLLYCFIKTKISASRSKKRCTLEDKRQIEKFKNIHLGERCFIVGTGPSLAANDLDLLKDEISFGVNNVVRAYESTEWRPDYYAIFDNTIFRLLTEARNSDVEYKGIFAPNDRFPKMEKDGVVDLPVDYSCTYCINTIWNKILPRLFNRAAFSKDISEVIYSGTTVVYTCMQIANYMGFKEIYLLGVDCNYSDTQKHSSIAMDDMELEYEDSKWMRAERNMLCQFETLAKNIKGTDINIYNATRGGKLDCFPRVKLEDVLNR